MATTAAGAPAFPPPNRTLYVHNLPSELHKEDLKRNLYMLFATYGVVLDIVAVKNKKMRGQAHVVFRDIDQSTQAMRALDGFSFFGKDMSIAYAKGKSHAIIKLEAAKDPVFQPTGIEGPAREAPEQTDAQKALFGAAPRKAVPVNAPEIQEKGKGVKRAREEDEASEGEKETKPTAAAQQADEDMSDDEGAEMQISDSEEE